MFCRKCYFDLEEIDGGKCPNCNCTFDVSNPKTFLSRPFPTSMMIITQIILTTILGILCAFIVTVFQAVRSSGH